MTQTSNTKSVLIVDDTPTNVGVISGVLKDLYRTKVATNGEKALVLAAASEKPDLILLDVMMPGMDGYEVCRRLKANPLTRDIPATLTALRTASWSAMPSTNLLKRRPARPADTAPLPRLCPWREAATSRPQEARGGGKRRRGRRPPQS